MDAIRNSKVFIVVLSKDALNRCENPSDWVRQDILYANEQQVHIVPVEFDKGFRAMPSDIPDTIQSIFGARSWAQIDTETLLRASIGELVKYRIIPYLEQDESPAPSSRGSSPKPQGSGAEIHVYADDDSQVYRFSECLGTIHAGEDYVLRLTPGNHRLRFVSTAYDNIDFVLKKYSVPDLLYTDIIDVELRARISEKQQAEEDSKRKAAEEARLKELESLKLKLFEHDGKYGYKDETDRVVIPCQYWHVEDFSEGLADVKNADGKWVKNDKTGKVVG